MTTRRTNLATNPSFEAALAGVTAGGGATNTQSSAWAAAGAYSLQVSTAGSTGPSTAAYPWGLAGAMAKMGMAPGKTYTVSATARLTAVQAGSLDALARCLAVGSVTPGGGTNYTFAPSPPAPNGAGVTRLSVTFTVPADATNMFVRLMNGEGPGGSGGSVWWDAILIEEGTTAGAYFDGGTAAHDNVAYRWLGTANASASEEYYTLPTVLVEELEPSPAPSVGITVVALGNTPTVFNVWRVAGGRRTLVRGGRNREAVDSDYLEDYEVPFNIPVTYEVEILSSPGVTQQTYPATITVESAVGWMQDPLVPGSAIPVDGERRQDGAPVLRPSTLSSLMYEADLTLMQVLGSRDPVALLGQRASAAGVDFNLFTKAAEHSNDMRDLLMSAGVILVRPVAPWGDPLPPLCYIAAGSVKEIPWLSITGQAGTTDWEIKSPLVKAPSMDVLVPRWTWGDVEALYATWGQAEAALAGMTWLDVTKNPTGA